MHTIKEKIMQAVTATLVLIAIGTIFYHKIDGLNWVDSLYFTVSTLTTVGYGDFAPVDDFSKIFTTVFMLAGISVMLYTATMFGAYSVESGIYSKPFNFLGKKINKHRDEKEAKLAREIEHLISKLNLKTQELEEEQRKSGKAKPRYKHRKENN